MAKHARTRPPLEWKYTNRWAFIFVVAELLWLIFDPTYFANSPRFGILLIAAPWILGSLFGLLLEAIQRERRFRR